MMESGMPQNYDEAVDYIENLPKFTKKHTLDHTRAFLGYLGNPENGKKVIHVAGTNGKGSVCAYMQAILEAEEKEVGFFTSPHLVSMNERIQVNRQMINNQDFFQVFCKVYEAVKKMEQDGLEHPSYFEFLFGMGMCAFEMKGVEIIILETGLGGRLDATNAIEKPCLTVITSISLDHTDILGDTIEKIAMEKAGIIKENVPVFYDGSDKEASEVIRKMAEKKGSLCKEITNHAFEIREVCSEHIAFCRRNAYDECNVWKIPICGLYQVMNAEIAIEAMEYLFENQRNDLKKWMKAIFDEKWEGRMEHVAEHFLLDGAHNPGAIKAFVESTKAVYPGEKPIVIFSVVSDKKYEKMVEYLCSHLDAKAYIVTQIDDWRKVESEKLAFVFQKYTDKPVYEKKELKDAIEFAYSIREEEEIFCLGSLYLVGMVKKCLMGGK